MIIFFNKSFKSKPVEYLKENINKSTTYYKNPHFFVLKNIKFNSAKVKLSPEGNTFLKHAFSNQHNSHTLQSKRIPQFKQWEVGTINYEEAKKIKGTIFAIYNVGIQNPALNLYYIVTIFMIMERLNIKEENIHFMKLRSFPKQAMDMYYEKIFKNIYILEEMEGVYYLSLLYFFGGIS